MEVVVFIAGYCGTGGVFVSGDRAADNEELAADDLGSKTTGTVFFIVEGITSSLLVLHVVDDCC